MRANTTTWSPEPVGNAPGNSRFARRVPRQGRHDRRSAPDRVARRRRLAAQGEVRRQNENGWNAPTWRVRTSETAVQGYRGRTVP